MAKNYEVGKTYYMPVNVCVDKCDGNNFPIVIEFDDGENKIYNSVKDEHGILLTAEEVAGSLKTKADVMEVVSDSLQEENEELRAKLDEFKETIGKQSEKLRELQTRIADLNEVNSSLGENRDALNNEAAVHMTSIHNLQVAVEVLAEKISEMRYEQDG